MAYKWGVIRSPLTIPRGPSSKDRRIWWDESPDGQAYFGGFGSEACDEVGGLVWWKFGGGFDGGEDEVLKHLRDKYITYLCMDIIIQYAHIYDAIISIDTINFKWFPVLHACFFQTNMSSPQRNPYQKGNSRFFCI